jgi:hypothetical protein
MGDSSFELVPRVDLHRLGDRPRLGTTGRNRTRRQVRRVADRPTHCGVACGWTFATTAFLLLVQQ